MKWFKRKEKKAKEVQVQTVQAPVAERKSFDEFADYVDDHLENTLSTLGVDEIYIHYTNDNGIELKHLHDDDSEFLFKEYSLCDLYEKYCAGEKVKKDIYALLNQMVVDIFHDVDFWNDTEDEEEYEEEKEEEMPWEYDADDYDSDDDYEDCEEEEMPVVDNSKRNITITLTDTESTLTYGEHTITVKRYHKDKHDEVTALDELIKKYKAEREKEKAPQVGDMVQVVDEGNTYDNYDNWLVDNNIHAKSVLKWKSGNLPKKGNLYKITATAPHNKWSDKPLYLIESDTETFIIGQKGIRKEIYGPYYHSRRSKSPK